MAQDHLSDSEKRLTCVYAGVPAGFDYAAHSDADMCCDQHDVHPVVVTTFTFVPA